MMLDRMVTTAALLCALLAPPAQAHAQGPAPAAAPAAVATSPAPAAPAIPYKQDKHGAGALAYQSLAALVLAGLAAYGIVLFLKKSGLKGVGPLRSTRRVRLLESTRLSRRSTLHVVDYRGQELLLAESEHGLRLLHSGPGATVKGDGDA